MSNLFFHPVLSGIMAAHQRQHAVRLRSVAAAAAARRENCSDMREGPRIAVLEPSYTLTNSLEKKRARATKPTS